MKKANRKDIKGIAGDVVEIKYGVSRGYETYGYTTVGFWVNGEKKSYCSGGGYDMEGTVFGEFIKETFKEELKRINCKDYYGLSFYNTKTRKGQNRWSKTCNIHLDGACGRSCMDRVFNKLGYKLRFVSKSANKTTYMIETL